MRLLTADRWAALATGLGMIIATLVFSGRGPGGSVIVPADRAGIVWTMAVPVLVCSPWRGPTGVAAPAGELD